MYKIPANTLLLGKNIVFVPECRSTNDYALSLPQSTPEGTVVITNNQTAGRGQRGNSWEAERGKNLTFSIILRPRKLAVVDQFYLNICTSLAIHDYIKEKTGALVQIKWPNDVLIESMKVCGILIENQLQGSSFSNCIIGIGLNVNQQNFMNARASSVSMNTHMSYILEDELCEVLGKIEGRYLAMENQQYKKLLDEYLKAMYWLNEEHLFGAHDEEFEGRITGVDRHGRLEVTVRSKKKYFGVKEIVYKS